MPALDRLHGLRVVADPAALDAARWQGDATSPSSASRRTTRSRSAPSGVDVDDEHAIVEPEAGFAGAWLPVDAVAAPPRVVAPDGATGARPGRRRAGPRPRLAARRRRRAPHHRRGLRRRTREPPAMSAYTDTLLADPLAGRAAEGELRRRHHRRRRPRPVDRLLPRDPPRHHERRGPRGRLHRLGQHRPEHDDHPRQLRHPRGDPLLPALARAVPGPRGGDRRRDPPPDQGHLLGRPHRDGDAHRARPRPDEHGLRREDRHGHPGRAQGARPAGRPDRWRPLPGPRRLAPPRGRHGPPRPGRLGVRRRARRSAVSRSTSTRRSPGSSATATAAG